MEMGFHPSLPSGTTLIPPAKRIRSSCSVPSPGSQSGVSRRICVISTTGRSGNYPSQGQLYFRGHPEWGNLLYGGGGTREGAE